MTAHLSPIRCCAAIAALAFGLAPLATWAEAVRVLDVMIIGENRVGGEKVGEFSALVNDPSGAGVLAVSDRGYVAALAVDVVDDRLARIDVTALHVLSGPDGRPLSEGDFNPEAAALLPDGGIAIVDETAARLAVFDATGRWLRDEVLPAAISDTALQASDKDGIEALGWTPDTGFIAVTEEPQRGQPRHLHRVHTSHTAPWLIDLSGIDSVSIKAMESVGDRLFVLERVRDDTTEALVPFVRILDLSACQTASTCTGRRLSVDLDGLVDADFEGLAHLGDGRFLMVSDDKIDGDLRSVFVLFTID